MAALLVAIAVMSVLLSAAMPVWRQQVQREKEEELVFRGRQYVRAIELYQRKMPGALPPSIDILVTNRFLRNKYKDPMTEDGEFQILYAGALQQQQPGAPAGGAGSRGTVVSPLQPVRSPQAGPSAPAAGAPGGMIGVASKSKEKSIRLYNGRGHYNEWQFIFAGMSGRPGAPGGAPRPGGPTAPGIGPGTGPGTRRPGQGPGPGPFGGPGPRGPGEPPRPRPPGPIPRQPQ
jgi:type II secretory pathway pseudopilin PulG